ncbi:GPN-loop GTPase 3 [Histomonas meleagridis]|uniref:GPN-loop GTPase 3 n=1 Tax=Histomonas meleagridis TaxID=135588 RepID=UPI00355A2471|nr:GPN-loop GTPase 3 [Histomonas meleagridis]KAH0802676.1 GPN-loop GTPase 3 [Histomonas meleagridis]
MTTRFAQVIIGPAGSGKSTYIANAKKHFDDIKRIVHCVNLDPAADSLPYDPEIDIREAIDIKDIMQKQKLGPNGALVFCLESVAMQSKWFDEVIGEHEYDYLLIDMPGQIELYSHLTVLPELLSNLTHKGYSLIMVFLVDAQFLSDPGKFLSTSLVALSTMTMLELPHINVISKCDLLPEEDLKKIDDFTEMETFALMDRIKPNSTIAELTNKICELIDTFRLVQFRMLNLKEEDSLSDLIQSIDMIIQYYENADYGDEEFHEVADEEGDYSDLIELREGPPPF